MYMHALMHVAIYNLPGAAAICAAKIHSSAYNCIEGNVQPRGDFAKFKINAMST